MDATLLVILGLVWLSLTCLGVYVSIAKGRPGFEGVILALILGPLGILVAVLMPTVERMHYAPRPRREVIEEQEDLPDVVNWRDWAARG